MCVVRVRVRVWVCLGTDAFFFLSMSSGNRIENRAIHRKCDPSGNKNVVTERWRQITFITFRLSFFWVDLFAFLLYRILPYTARFTHLPVSLFLFQYLTFSWHYFAQCSRYSGAYGYATLFFFSFMHKFKYIVIILHIKRMRKVVWSVVFNCILQLISSAWNYDENFCV